MHEWAIIRQVVDEVVEKAKEHNLKNISSVTLSIGDESDLTEDSVRFCFDSLKSGTILEKAILHLKRGKGGGVVIESFEGE